jgi:hypothetical protein
MIYCEVLRRYTPREGCHARCINDSLGRVLRSRVSTLVREHAADLTSRVSSAFELVMLTSLGRTYYQGGNVGKVLYVVRQIGGQQLGAGTRAALNDTIS